MDYKKLNKVYMQNAYTHVYAFVVNHKGTMRVCLFNKLTTRTLNNITHIDTNNGEIVTRMNNTKECAKYLVEHSDVCYNTRMSFSEYLQNAEDMELTQGFYAEVLVADILKGTVNSNRTLAYNVAGDVVLDDGTHVQVKTYNATIAKQNRDKAMAKK